MKKKRKSAARFHSPLRFLQDRTKFILDGRKPLSSLMGLSLYLKEEKKSNKAISCKCGLKPNFVRIKKQTSLCQLRSFQHKQHCFKTVILRVSPHPPTHPKKSKLLRAIKRRLMEKQKTLFTTRQNFIKPRKKQRKVNKLWSQCRPWKFTYWRPRPRSHGWGRRSPVGSWALAICSGLV